MSFQSVPPVEIGSLNAASPNETLFIGSSSGIFFANTVRRALKKSKHNLSHDRPVGRRGGDQFFVDDCITGDEPERGSPSLDNAASTSPGGTFDTTVPNAYGIYDQGLGSPPSREHARDLVMLYFRLWHPLFPFLHGPTFLEEVENFYDTRPESHTAGHGLRRANLCRAITFQCIFNISGLESSLPSESRIKSASVLISLLGEVVTRNDIQCFEALLAMQLYLIATTSLRAASTVGGMLLRSIFHSGFHRCPFRYSQLSQQDCDIRKRIFWSAYVADRYLSQALGYPLGIQDSDIDVCIPGTIERHQRLQAAENAFNAEEEVSRHLPNIEAAQSQSDLEEQNDQIERASENGQESLDAADGDENAHSAQRRHGEDIFASYVEYGRFTGKIVELFHKSIHIRSVDLTKILVLTAEVNGWWNALPSDLQEHSSVGQYLQDRPSQDSHNLNIGSYFAFIYHQMILLINRPFLSLNPKTPEFRSSLQTCIGASRSILSTLQQFSNGGQYPSWPGILSGTWMSGLVLAFSCALKSYPFKKGSIEIQACLRLLDGMINKSTTAKHCHDILSILLDDLRANYDKGITQSSALPSEQKPLSPEASSVSHTLIEPGLSTGDEHHQKRQRLNAPRFHNLSTPTNTQSHSSEHITSLGGSNGPDENSWSGLGPLDNIRWAQDPDLGNVEQDIFGNLSWEALFQDDTDGLNWTSM